MSQTPLPPSSADELQFDMVEPGQTVSGPVVTPAMSCIGCRQPIATEYYALANKIICPSCYQQVSTRPMENPVAGILKALVFGLGAGLLGALIWFAIRRVAQVQIGLIAILVGFMVGKAVLKGSGGIGGQAFQILAIVLTYGCIAANYMPDYFESYVNVQQASGASPSTGQLFVGFAGEAASDFVDCLQIPFNRGAHGIIGLLIIAIALREAWRLTAQRIPPVTGPYQVGGGVTGPAGAST